MLRHTTIQRLALVAALIGIAGQVGAEANTGTRDAALIFSTAALDIAATAYVNGHHAPNATVRDLNPFCNDGLLTCALAKTGASVVAFALVTQLRNGGHGTAADVGLAGIMGVNLLGTAINVRNALRKN